DVTSALKEGGRSGEGHRRTSARSLLLIGEVALSLMLLVGAGLMIKSFLRLQEVRPGFNAHNVLIANLALQGPKYKDDQQCVEFFRQLEERLEAVPGRASGGRQHQSSAQREWLWDWTRVYSGRPAAHGGRSEGRDVLHHHGRLFSRAPNSVAFRTHLRTSRQC